MHEERQINPLPASLVPHREGIRSVAKKGIAIQCKPLTGVLTFILPRANPAPASAMVNFPISCVPALGRP